MDGLKTSTLPTRGQARGGVGSTHQLTEAKEREYAASIERMAPRENNPRGHPAMTPQLGARSGTPIGTFLCSPEVDSINTPTPHSHGDNTDLLDISPPEEMANAAVFTASPAAGFITGTHLVADDALTRGVRF